MYGRVFDIDVDLLLQEVELDSSQDLFIQSGDSAALFRPDTFFEIDAGATAAASFDDLYMDMLLEQSQRGDEPTVDKVLFTYMDEIIVTGGGGLPEPDAVEFYDIWQLLLALGGLSPTPANTGDDSDEDSDPSTIAVPISVPPGEDPNAAWGTLLSLIPEFEMLGFDLDAFITLINNPGTTPFPIPTPDPSCVLPVTPGGGFVPLDQLNDTHANALTDFLSAMGASTASSSIGGTIPGNYHAHNESTTFTLGDLANILSDITIVSGDINYDVTNPIRTGGHFNLSTHVLTIGTHITDFSDIVQIIVHEALHAYIDLTPSLAHVIDHGQYGVTSQEHQAWFEQIVDDLIAQLEANVIGGIEDNADCS